MEKLTMSEIQKESLKVLLKIDEICEKEGLVYYLAYGTLIGAVRHHGYIPWDDDVDIWMPRKDYEAFKKYFLEHEEELKPFKYCCRENTKNYEYYIPRISNMDFAYHTTKKGKKPFDIGVFVDIYPLDGEGNDRSWESVFNKIISINRNYSMYLSGKSSSQWYKTLGKFPKHVMLKLKKGKDYPKHVNQEVDAVLKQYSKDTDTYIGCPAWTEEFTQYRREWFGKPVKIEFAGHMLNAPEHYHELLTTEYGDYMQLPPKEQRVSTHDYYITRRKK